MKKLLCFALLLLGAGCSNSAYQAEIQELESSGDWTKTASGVFENHAFFDEKSFARIDFNEKTAEFEVYIKTENEIVRKAQYDWQSGQLRVQFSDLAENDGFCTATLGMRDEKIAEMDNCSETVGARILIEMFQGQMNEAFLKNTGLLIQRFE